MLMRLASVFGLVFAALAEVGRPELVFTCNAVSCFRRDSCWRELTEIGRCVGRIRGLVVLTIPT